MKHIIDSVAWQEACNGIRCRDCFMLDETGGCRIEKYISRQPVHEERPHGEWVEVPKYKGFYVCSKCLERLDGNFERFEHWEMRKDNFCHVCGSDNRPKEKTETNDRDCGSCVHYKLYKDNDLFACEVWECKYEPRDKED